MRSCFAPCSAKPLQTDNFFVRMIFAVTVTDFNDLELTAGLQMQSWPYKLTSGYRHSSSVIASVNVVSPCTALEIGGLVCNMCADNQIRRGDNAETLRWHLPVQGKRRCNNEGEQPVQTCESGPECTVSRRWFAVKICDSFTVIRTSVAILAQAGLKS